MSVGKKKKILMVCSVWHEDYISALLSGMRKRITQEDAQLYVLASYDSDAEFQKKEQEIFTLAKAEDYDGMLCAVNSVGNDTVMEKLIGDWKEHGKPVLSIDQQLPGASFIGVDNYHAFYELVEHMVKVHGYRTINYLGGPKEHEENRERFQAFTDCLAHYNIPVESDRVLHLNFVHSDGDLAYHIWKEKNMHLPDAVICANDNMAVGYCSAAARDGYCAPDDFKITGFDNFDEGQFFCPSITSVNRNWEQLGYDSVSHILDLIDKKEAGNEFFSKGKIVQNESCGCGMGKRDLRSDFRNMYLEKIQEEHLEERQRKNRQLLCTSSTLEEFRHNLKPCFERLGVRNIIFRLNPGALTGGKDTKFVGYEQHMLEISGDTGWKEERIFLLVSLHFNKNTFGYSETVYEDKLMKNHLHRTLMETVSLALENIRQKEEVQRINERLQELYVRDQLTGLYNRFGYAQLAQQYFAEQSGRIYLVYVDVDNLKTINDNYGHAMGDKAIKGVADAIKEVYREENILVRMGGDEFLVIGKEAGEKVLSEKEKAVGSSLKEYSEREKLPFMLTASMGHVHNLKNAISLETLVKNADARMYEIKQRRKKAKFEEVRTKDGENL